MKTLSDVLNDVLTAIAGQCDAQLACLWRLSRNRRALRLDAMYVHKELMLGTSVDFAAYRPGRKVKAGSLWRELCATRRPVSLRATEDRRIPLRNLLTEANLKRALLIPLMDEDDSDSAGLIVVALREPNPIQPDTIEIAAVLAQQIAMAWKMNRLLGKRLNFAILEERNRIARDLHDILAQAFAGILIQAELVEDVLPTNHPEIRRHVSRVRQLAREGLGDVRRTIFGLQPRSLKKCCLAEALRQLTAEFNAASGGARAEFTLQGALSGLPGGTQSHLLRITQEALTNVLKHARAAKVGIAIAVDGGFLQLSVRDDGVGFDPGATAGKGGLGLKGIQDRTRLMGGRLRVGSQPARGTQIQVTIPVKGKLKHMFSGGSMRRPGQRKTRDTPAVQPSKLPTLMPVDGHKVIRVLTADDAPVVLEGLKSLINRAPDMRVVAEACDGETAVAYFAIHRPDVVLLDVRMPRMDGVAAVAAIRKLDPAARVVLLSAYGGDELVYQGLRAGAKGYLMKDTPQKDLVAAIHTAYAGSSWIPPVIASKLVDRVTRSELTIREMEVLRLMVAGKSNKEIGVALCIGEGTVKVHVSNLLKKLKAAGRAEAINLALVHGLVSLE